MKLSDFDHLRSLKTVSFKTESVGGVDFTIIAYAIADTDFWKLPLALETRGITFRNDTGECVCRPFEKFFNLNENDWSAARLLDFSDSVVRTKRDGSMLTPVLVSGEVFWKTKKSFYSDVAVEAAAVANEDSEFTKNVKRILEFGYTPIFEYTSPNNRIVIDYGVVKQFVLLALRNIVTGEYMEVKNNPLASKFDVIGGNRPHDTAAFIESVPAMKSIEGFVISCKNAKGEPVFVKVKTQWYFDQHYVMTDARERDIAQAVLNENIDDLKALVATTGKSVQLIEDIEHRVVTLLNEIKAKTESLAELIKSEPDRKTAALKYSNNTYFGLAMKIYSGMTPDYTGFFTRNILKQQFGLTVVYNPSF